MVGLGRVRHAGEGQLRHGHAAAGARGELSLVDTGHVTTILIADWLRGDAAREQRRRVVPGPAPDQVSCGWLGAGHVTTMLTSDWSRVCHVACPDIAATMPKIDARRLDGKKHRTSSALRGNMGLK